MEKTWRWFGPDDPITLPMLRQIGVEGIVTALHRIPNGEVWPLEAIQELKGSIESYGLRWSVVESLPVSECIKFGGKDRERQLENYRISLRNLGKAGVRTVCYNFMPVIDWIRTDIMHRNPNGTYSLHFDKSKFAYFDCRILKRAGAEKEYDAEELAKVEELEKTLSDSDRQTLVENIIVKTQGFVNGNIKESDQNPVELFRKILARYDGIGKAELRANMKYFLESVMPACDEANVNLCVHPDDPPMPVLGLPRIVSNDDDISWFLNAVDDPHNGLTFCAGSLSSGLSNDVPALALKYAKRTHFVHLRSTAVEPSGNFTEAPHIGGRADLVDVIRIFESMHPEVPMRVDHGPLMLGDVDGRSNPGYSFYGRMFALAEVTGMMAVVKDELDKGLDICKQ